MSSAWRRLFEMLDQRANDQLSQSAALMLGLDSDVDYLERQSSVADNTSHTDDLARPVYRDSKNSVGEPNGCAFSTLCTKPRVDPKLPVLVGRGSAGDQIITLN